MYSYSRILLNVWRCCFIAPVIRKPADTNGGDQYAVSTLWYVTNLGVLFACLASGVWTVVDDLNASNVGRSLRMQNTSSAVVTVVQLSLMSMVCTLAVTGSAGRHRTLMDIERQLRRVDAALGVTVRQTMGPLSFFLVMFHAVLFTVDGYLWYNLSPVSWMYFVCYVYLFIDLAAMLMYAQIARNIGSRFDRVNVEIERKLAGSWKNISTSAYYGRDPVKLYHHPRKFIENSVAAVSVDSRFDVGEFFF